MTNATLAQGNGVLNLILQKRTSDQSLQGIIESGVLADVFSADFESINRNALQSALGIAPKITILPDRWWIEINRTLGLSWLIEGTRIHVVPNERIRNPLIEKSHSQDLPHAAEFRLIYFDDVPNYVKTGHPLMNPFDVKRIIEGYGFIPADDRELIAFAKVAKASEYRIVGFGSEHSIWYGDVGATKWPTILPKKEGWAFDPIGFGHMVVGVKEPLAFLVRH